MAVNGVYGAAAREVFELFEDYLDGDAGRPAIAIGSHACGSNARDALLKSLKAFGYSDEACTFACLSPLGSSGEDAVSLDAEALFLLVEGIDPLYVVATDAGAVQSLADAYRTQFPLNAPIRVLGRPSAAFADLEALLQTQEGKQLAWNVLKSLQTI